MQQNKQTTINPSHTRWLALGQCVSMVLKRWTILFSLLSEVALEDKYPISNRIFHDLNCFFTRVYPEFLNCVLPVFNSLCVIFQPDSILIASLASECEHFLKIMTANFMKSDVIRGDGLYNSNPKHSSNLLPYSEVKIGATA